MINYDINLSHKTPIETSPIGIKPAFSQSHARFNPTNLALL